MKINLSSLKESNEFLNLLMENMTSAVFIVDKKVRLYRFNDTFRKLFDKHEAELINRLCGNAIGCVFTVDEDKLCGDTSHCGNCILRSKLISAFMEKIPTYKTVLNREFYVGDVKLKKHFLFSAMYIQYEGQEMVLVILDDVTAIEKQRVELANKQKRIDEDLVSAAGIQRSLLPPSFPVVENVRFASRFLPCERVGGDIFNVFALNEDKTAMYILDVSGHGVPAALVTVSVSQMLNPVTGYFCTPDGRKPSSESGLDSPKTVLETLDKDYPIERFDKYFSMCYAVLDHRLGLLRYSNAGHPAPILLRRDGSIETLNRGGTIIGLGGLMQFEEEVKALEPGDRVFFYTDGITEYFSDTGEAFGADRMRRTLRELRGAPLRTMLDGLVAAATSFGAGSRADDDITLLVMEYR